MRVKPSSKQLMTGCKWTEEYAVWSAFQSFTRSCWPPAHQLSVSRPQLHRGNDWTSCSQSECIIISRGFMSAVKTSVFHTSCLDSGSWPPTCGPTRLRAHLQNPPRGNTTYCLTHTPVFVFVPRRQGEAKAQKITSSSFFLRGNVSSSSIHIFQIYTLSNNH